MSVTINHFILYYLYYFAMGVLGSRTGLSIGTDLDDLEWH